MGGSGILSLLLRRRNNLLESFLKHFTRDQQLKAEWLISQIEERSDTDLSAPTEGSMTPKDNSQ